MNEERKKPEMPDSGRAGNPDRITRDYFDSLLIRFRHIDAAIPDTTLTLFGGSFSTPIMTAALSHLDFCCEGGTVTLAKGAAAANAVNWTGLCENDELCRICDTGARTIRIVKPYENETLIFDHIACAERAGCIAVGMDIDHVFTRTGTICEVFGERMAPKSEEMLARYAAATRLPFIAKGILSVEDAVKCADAGLAGIVVSHHHGMLDFAVPPLMVLPEIRAAVGDRLKIFVDCGITGGMDAFKALALGADAVSVGRPLMPVLSERGAVGVTDEINKYTDELRGAMAFTGSRDIESIRSDIIVKRVG